jgi:hypothetical protein
MQPLFMLATKLDGEPVVIGLAHIRRIEPARKEIDGIGAIIECNEHGFSIEVRESFGTILRGLGIMVEP